MKDSKWIHKWRTFHGCLYLGNFGPSGPKLAVIDKSSNVYLEVSNDVINSGCICVSLIGTNRLTAKYVGGVSVNEVQ